MVRAFLDIVLFVVCGGHVLMSCGDGDWEIKQENRFFKRMMRWKMDEEWMDGWGGVDEEVEVGCLF